jgi:hypothetical protein
MGHRVLSSQGYCEIMIEPLAAFSIVSIFFKVEHREILLNCKIRSEMVDLGMRSYCLRKILRFPHQRTVEGRPALLWCIFASILFNKPPKAVPIVVRKLLT